MVAARTAAAAAATATTPLLSRVDSSGYDSDNRSASTVSIKYERDPRLRTMRLAFSFASALLACLCVGSIQAYSLYGHLFQERLGYTQLQVNSVSIASGIALYATVPPLGFLCDRIGASALSQAAAIVLPAGYILGAFAYRSGATGEDELPKEGRWPVWVMVVAFTLVGAGTTLIYVAAVASNAKNFGRGKFKGVALAAPITCVGLGGMLLSQIGSRALYETLPNGRKGDVDVFKFFIFMAIAIFIVGVIGAFGLQVVDEEELIDDAVDELERSGFLEDGAFRRLSEHDEDTSSLRGVRSHLSRQEESEVKKTLLLNAETREFLQDPTMWWITIGFCLIVGPGEAFMNNLGTIIGTLQPPAADAMATSAATHVSIMAIGSTISRLAAGTITDLLAPPSASHHFQGSAANSIASLPPRSDKFSISRISFLVFFSLLMVFAELFLASGLVQNHPGRFWIVSLFMGCGYGAIFTVTPIIVTVVWGVENFGTNWGIICMAPVVGGTTWSLIYSTIYQWAAANSPYRGGDGPEDTRCYGKDCYSITFWAIAITSWIGCGLVLWSWKGKGGWSKRGIAV